MTVFRSLTSVFVSACLLALAGAAPSRSSPQDPVGPAPEGNAAPPAEEADRRAEIEAAPPEVEHVESAEPADDSGGSAKLEQHGETEKPEPAATASPWQERVETLKRQILLGDADRAEVDTLLRDVNTQLRSARDQLRNSFQDGVAFKNLRIQHEQMETLYDARLLLLEEATAALRVRTLGMSADGVREAQEEMDRLQLHMWFQAVRLPITARNLMADLRTSPVPLLKGLLALVVAIIVFRLWRRWVQTALPALRQRLINARPRRRLNLRFAKLAWYVERLRNPVEWLLLLMVIASIIQAAENIQDEEPIRLIVKWTFIGWAGLRLVDAIAARGGSGMGRDSSGLRHRSLKLVWGWIAAFGLAMDLATDYVGHGTIHSWTWWVFIVLAMPVLLILLHWWKEEIFLRLSNAPDPPAYVERLLARSKKRQGYVPAAMGGIFLFARGLRRDIIRFFSNFEVGRRLQAHIFRREVERQANRTQEQGEPLPEHLQEGILGGQSLISKVYRKELKSVTQLAGGGSGWTVALIGEKGIGKSTFLRRLSSELGDRMLIVDCPVGDFDALYQLICKRLGLGPSEQQDLDALERALRQREIDIVALDNVHRLASPVIGGFHEYGRGIEMRRRLGPGFSWIVTFDSIAFQFIRRLRADSALVAQEIELGSWTEDHIGELLQERAEAAGIEASFDNLVLPRQLDEASYEVDGDRKRHGFNRIIWDSSLGNPGVALRMWCESLTVTDDGKVDVRLGSKRTRSSLDTLSLTSQFVLRSIAQMEYARQVDVVKALDLPPAEVDLALQAAKANGLIEEQDGLFSISWPWYREITRFLSRRNLLASP